jgi:hypothetical protein
MSETGLHVCVSNDPQSLQSRTERADGGQTLLSVAPVRF